MIGLPIGAAPIGGFIQPVPLAIPNILLSGTLDFGGAYRVPGRLPTFLNFGLITNDDNTAQVNLVNVQTSQPIPIIAASLKIYAPNTIINPVLSPAATVIGNGFQFTIPRSAAASLLPGMYPWIAVVTQPDGTEHTVNLGDECLSTGVMTVFNQPYLV